MKPQEIRAMSVEELKDTAASLRKNIFNLKTQAHTKELKNHTQIQAARRDLARVMTILNEKGSKA
jgi:large subunit ribosomal protein L29